ncbi:MAG: hypothetical protein ABI268_11625 [Rhodanobacter sp.]
MESNGHWQALIADLNFDHGGSTKEVFADRHDLTTVPSWKEPPTAAPSPSAAQTAYGDEHATFPPKVIASLFNATAWLANVAAGSEARSSTHQMLRMPPEDDALQNPENRFQRR